MYGAVTPYSEFIVGDRIANQGYLAKIVLVTNDMYLGTLNC